MTYLYKKKAWSSLPQHCWPSPTQHHGRPQGQMVMPKSGSWGNRKIKHMLPRGFWKVLVHNIKELEVLLLRNSSCCSEIAHISSKIGKAIPERAGLLAVRVTNQTPMLGCTGKKANRQLTCTLYLW